jgi:DNA-binding MarR family transcriptional regulator
MRHQAEVARAAEAVVATVPRAMRQIRATARGATAGLSVPQFRAMRYVDRHPGTGLTPLAEHLGISLPAASALVGRLAAAGLVARDADPTERRRLAITLTDRGRDRIAGSAEAVHAWWRARLSGLADGELSDLVDALEVLDAVLAAAEAAPDSTSAAGIA